jgi:hypothetical protein
MLMLMMILMLSATRHKHKSMVTGYVLRSQKPYK